MVNAGSGIHAEVSAAKIKPATKINIFIIASSKHRIEATDFLKDISADQNGMSSKIRGRYIATLSQHIAIKIISGITVTCRNDRC